MLNHALRSFYCSYSELSFTNFPLNAIEANSIQRNWTVMSSCTGTKICLLMSVETAKNPIFNDFFSNNKPEYSYMLPHVWAHISIDCTHQVTSHSEHYFYFFLNPKVAAMCNFPCVQLLISSWNEALCTNAFTYTITIYIFTQWFNNLNPDQPTMRTHYSSLLTTKN